MNPVRLAWALAALLLPAGAGAVFSGSPPSFLEQAKALDVPPAGEGRVAGPAAPAAPEAAVQGLEVLRGFVSQAYARLRERRVVSLSYPGRSPDCAPNCLAADVVPDYISAALVLNEHIDPGDFSGEDKTPGLVLEALVRLAADSEHAWSRSVSKAGARGIMQFMPATYRFLVRTYPEAGLQPDFRKGTADPVNSIMAQVLLCDLNWSAIRQGGYEIPAAEVGPYLAAAYNGGASRLLTLLKDPEHMKWMRNPDLELAPTRTVVRTARRGKSRKPVQVSRVKTVLPLETTKYVVQFDWIRTYWQRFVEEPRSAF